MESDQDVERIQLAIQKLMEDKQRQKGGSIRTIDDDNQLLAKLLSQVGGGSKELPRVSKERNRREAETAAEGVSIAAVEEIAKELRAVKKQNRITHWLLSALIVVTLGWQLSEVSIILKVKDRFSHPFRSLGQLLVGNFNGPQPNGNGGAADADGQNSNNKQQQSRPLIEIPFTSHSTDS